MSSIGAISFSVDSHTPYLYQRCYCSVCRKSAGGGGYAINIMGVADTLKLRGKTALGYGMHRSTAIRARPTGITASAAARRSGSAMSNGLSWCTRLPRRSIRSYLRRLRACICCCATKRAGSTRKSALLTTVSTVFQNCRSRIGTRDTSCGSNEQRPQASAKTLKLTVPWRPVLRRDPPGRRGCAPSSRPPCYLERSVAIRASASQGRMVR